MMNWLYPIVIPLLLNAISDSKDGAVIRGIYGDPAAFWNLGWELKDLGVNAVFIHSGSLSPQILGRARRNGAKVFAEFPTLNGKGYVENHPEAWPVDETGEKARAASWFVGVCPTNRAFKQSRLHQLRELLRKYDVDGVWIDYVHWHAQFEEPDPILPETCFCDSCLAAFQSAAHLHIPDGSIADKSRWILKNHDAEWRDWRCSVIAGWARDLKAVVRTEKPGALFGMFHCPWNDEEFDGARRRILGVDLDTLRETIDVFSPMVYHRRMGRSPAWVKENVGWFCKRMNIRPGQFPRVWPIVQAYNDPTPVAPEEFGEVLSYGLSSEASGVMMFTSPAVAEDARKTQIMKRVYMSTGNQE